MRTFGAASDKGAPLLVAPPLLVGAACCNVIIIGFPESKKLRRVFIEKDFYTWFGYLEDFFKKKSNNSFFIGELSIADITAWRVIRWFLSGNLEQIELAWSREGDE